MLYKTFSAAVYGIDASIIEVEVDVSGIKTNEDHFHTVGLPDAAVRESRDRVKAAKVALRQAKKAGDAVRKDEILVELETDKASMELPAEMPMAHEGTRRQFAQPPARRWVANVWRSVCGLIFPSRPTARAFLQLSMRKTSCRTERGSLSAR